MNDDIDDIDDLDDDYGSCDHCGCDLTDPGEALDGLCDRCLWELIHSGDG